MIDTITEALDNGDYVTGIFLDFSKAFDPVNHKILLYKLSHYGIWGSALDWFKSYISNRSQFVTYNRVASTAKPINCGVPQGTIFGPLLFLMYINDLYNVCQKSVPILFADDTNLFYSWSSLDDLARRINDELCNISTRLKVNKLSFDINKTHHIFFHRKKEPISVQIKIENETIDEVKQTKFPCVVIDSKLSWKKHIAHVCGKLSRSIGMMIKARQCLNRKALMTL